MKIFDLHQDLLSHIRFREQFGQSVQTGIALLQESQVTLVVATAFPLPADGNQLGAGVNDLITEELVLYRALQAENELSIISSLSDLQPNQLNLLLHIEGLNVFSDTAASWKQLADWVQLGVRSVGTHWNVDNELGAGTLNPTGQLTPLGAKVIAYLEQNSLVFDMAHMGRQTFFDAAKITTRPLYVSHGNVDVLCPNVRNYTDEQLHLIAESGGVIGVFFANTFVVGKDKQGAVADVVNHISYIKELIGIDHVALGSDFGGIVSGTVEQLGSIVDFENLYQALLRKGFSESEIEQVFYQNAQRVLAAHLR